MHRKKLDERQKLEQYKGAGIGFMVFSFYMLLIAFLDFLKLIDIPLFNVIFFGFGLSFCVAGIYIVLKDAHVVANTEAWIAMQIVLLSITCLMLAVTILLLVFFSESISPNDTFFGIFSYFILMEIPSSVYLARYAWKKRKREKGGSET